MKKVKITVVKTAIYPELVEKYGGHPMTPCDYNTPGMVFYTNGWQKPKGLCDNAWKSMVEYCFALAHGGEGIFGGSWMKDKKSALVSCNDGFRPVSYLLEATDEDAVVMDYDM